MNDPLTAHAETLSADAAAVAECAGRLRALARSLGGGTVPGWFAEAVDAHLTSCTIAAEDLSRAATQLRALASPEQF